MNARLGFGVIGAGYFGKHYIRLMQDMPDAELRAVADRSAAEKSENIKGLPAEIKISADARAIFSDSGIDAVVIATPVSSHHDLVVQALAAGKHVLVEKPATLSLAEAEAVERAVAASGRTFMTGHQYLYHDHMRVLKERIDQGDVGAVKYLFAEHLYPGPIRTDVGCWWETAVHECAAIDYLFLPGAVTKTAGAAIDFRGSGRDDFASVEMSFASGLTAAITVSWFAPEKVRRMTIAGDKGMAVFDDRREEKLKFFPHPYPTDVPAGGRSHWMAPTEGEVVAPVAGEREPLRNQLEHFITSIRTGTESLSGIGHTMRVMRMLDAGSTAIA